MLRLKDSNPAQRFPFITVLIIAVNIAVFVSELLLGMEGIRELISSFALVPARMFGASDVVAGVLPPGATILTAMFLHGGLLHITGNMVCLWIFGYKVENALGRVRFVVLYLLCGVIAATSYAATNRMSTVPMIGASGAISGVLGAYLILYPYGRVVALLRLGFFVKLIEIPSAAVLGVAFLLHVVNALVAPDAGGVAWTAHIGGFIAGMALISLFMRGSVPLWGKRRLERL